MKTLILAAAALIPLAIFPPAEAADQEGGFSLTELTNSLTFCKDIAGQEARLRCFDNIVPDNVRMSGGSLADRTAQPDAMLGSGTGWSVRTGNPAAGGQVSYIAVLTADGAVVRGVGDADEPPRLAIECRNGNPAVFISFGFKIVDPGTEIKHKVMMDDVIQDIGDWTSSSSGVAIGVWVPSDARTLAIALMKSQQVSVRFEVPGLKNVSAHFATGIGVQSLKPVSESCLKG